MSPKRWRLVFGASCALVALVASVPTNARTVAMQPPPQACDDPTDSISLFAEKIGKRRIGYGLSPGEASIPGPTIEMTEGDCLQITLVNDTAKKLSLHAHGVHYTVRSDGTGLNKSCVAPGRTRTYVFEAPGPITRTEGSLDPGTAGYWHYHDHCLGTPHGTGGIRKGLFGALVVRRPGDPVPDRPPFVVVMRDITINNRKAPNTPTFEANEGERVEFITIGHGDLMHTFHLHGHRWVDNRTGLPAGPQDATQIIDNKTLGPADSFGFQVIAGEGVGPGAWMYHCHVQGHSDAGMSGIFLVRTPGGAVTQDAREALAAWRTHGHVH
jgi:FtsP/CotA-like multicopper oxidase with cupredoxin domain